MGGHDGPGREGELTDPWVALAADADPGERSGALRRAHDVFTSAGRLERPVRAVVGASWRRSARARVSPDDAPAVELGPDELGPYRAAHPLARALPVIRELMGAYATDGEHLLAVCDAHGRLLWVEGHTAARRAGRPDELRGGRPLGRVRRRDERAGDGHRGGPSGPGLRRRALPATGPAVDLRGSAVARSPYGPGAGSRGHHGRRPARPPAQSGVRAGGGPGRRVAARAADAGVRIGRRVGAADRDSGREAAEPQRCSSTRGGVRTRHSRLLRQVIGSLPPVEEVPDSDDAACAPSPMPRRASRCRCPPAPHSERYPLPGRRLDSP